ncbi:hypothetical protein PFNF135_02831 [Plasmodium falciparum NF135/5.C10]|uniref:Duffy-binding-like domain-containing protein n=1 Tax=Plasmodium falciparum NF135/5.C10 TaxID=1036726 RepID=W4IHM0_PLAFA|nr:hypothetical protein PFNF135_02831 [Plasmodium falciparum NF135/5.C10]
MGSSHSTNDTKSPTLSESHNSARNVLEKIGKHIKDEINKKKNNTNKLKGTLSSARFLDGLYRSIRWGVRTGPGDSCELSHLFHTNITNQHERNPCHNRNQNRFDENAEAYCNNDKIRDNGERSAGGACAPFRRQNLCDKNLEYLINENTNTTHDLLGNVLVTAKYEGASIVEKHPNRGSSEVCTALARSFADIGDIIRGRDMFKPNDADKVQKGLQVVFKKIYKSLSSEVKNAYPDDGSENYYKLREAWWKANRDQVWRAITCNAPYKSRYFIQSENNTQLFSNRQCGHGEHEVLTNLDYVPQFLRWFDEWGEEFCRKRKDKLKKVKEACRGEDNKKYCSHNGYDCTQTIRNKDICIRESKCTDCSTKCKLYEIWLGNQREAFRKQKEKYEKEIQSYLSNDNKFVNNINSEYYKQFYEKLKNNEYATNDTFLNLLNEGKYCKKNLEKEEDITFTNIGEKRTFYRSEYCQVCPECGVKCDGTTCTPKTVIYPDCGKNEKYEPPGDAKTTDITVLYSADQEGDISKKLSEFCNDENNKNSQKWQCYYVSSENNGCKMEKKNGNNMSEEQITKFHNFFELWVTYLLTETITWKDKLRTCMNNIKSTDCIDECSTNCVCFDKWVKQKEQEWNSIKELLTEEQKNPKQNYGNINIYFESFFFHVMKKLNEEAKWNKLMDELRNKIELSKEKEGTKDLQDAIELLLEYLKETATICKDNNTNEACDPTVDPTQNPCINNTSGGGKHVNVKQIAQYYKRKAHVQLEERGGRSKLKGDASKGTYRRQGKPRKLKKVCRIAKDHSNRNHKDSRGRHLCTSNLEHLNTSSKGLSGDSVNDSFLGYVLLAAKYESEWIKSKYVDQSDNEGKCRAVRYSFADLGDIIKGTYLWEANPGEKTTQQKLQTIFSKIKEKNGGGTKGKYKEDNTKYTNLRNDWWEANRHQVWKAMLCEKNGINCDKGETPLDDYIPQRLRWLTEWAEWYCKMQSRLYEELADTCKNCKEGGKEKCKQRNSDCTTCDKKCKEYKEKINKWQKQWDKIQQKYKELYEEADRAATGSSDKKSTPLSKEDQRVVDFLKQLKEANKASGNTTYTTAAGYVHQEAKYLDCKTQTQFCKKKNGVKPPNGAEDDNYTFKDTPNGYDVACKCDENKQKPPETPKEDACKIVKELLKDKKATDDIDGCNQKYKAGKDKYPVWDCQTQSMNTENDGACMPPRRQKLCIYNLEHYINGRSTDQDLKEAFILCAAKETFLLWQKYKEDKQNKGQITWELDNVLNEGTIPDDFKRQMFYTFGDFRDFLFGTDISKNHGKESALAKKIDSLFPPNSGGKHPNGKTRQEWWNENGPYIWKGMLCALDKIAGNQVKLTNIDTYKYETVKFSDNRNGPDLETFAKRPQFLRWMIEWGEDFCKKRKEQVETLKGQCTKCDVSDIDGTCDKTSEGCKQCTIACEAYKSFIENWKKQWTQQSEKYQQLYNKAAQKYTNVNTEHEKPVVEYLSELLKKSGTSDGADTTLNSAGAYVKHQGYINDCDTQNKFETSDSNDNNYPFREKPYLYDKACNCSNDKLTPKRPEQQNDVCTIVQDVLPKHKNGQRSINSCNKKEKYPDWDCTKIKVNNNPTGICIPPRRQKLCVSGLTQEHKITKIEDIRTQFITCAAIETYFAWLKYKETNTEADNELQTGNIPEGFKRQMYYTFGDYRDIFFGTDITSHANILEVSKKVKKKLKEKNGEQKSVIIIDDEKLLPEWWNKHGKDIWEGMLCALTHDVNKTEKKSEIKTKYSYEELNEKTNGITSLEEFSSRPQFLRWFTEWGEEFCEEQTKRLATLKTQCPENTCTNGEESQKTCKIACDVYKKWLTNWKTQYNVQSKKYFDDKVSGKFKDDYVKDDVNTSTYAYEYLNKALPKVCTDGSCPCMDGESKHTSGKPEKSHDSHMPKSLDDEPDEVKGRCTCQKAPQPNFAGRSLPERDNVVTEDSEDDEDGDEVEEEVLPEEEEEEDEDVSHVDEDENPEVEAEEDKDGHDEDGDEVEETEENVEEDTDESEPPQQEASPTPVPAGPRPPPAPAAESLARILQPLDRKIDLPDSEEEDEEEEEEEKADTTETPKQDGSATTEKEVPKGPKVEGKPPCKIVETLFSDTTKFSDACTLKYGGNNSRLGWKCIPSGNTTGKSDASGSICVPPRRRKLYIGRLTQWANETLSSGESSAGGKETPSDKLRTAFIQSAAIETFFAWHRYKKENTKRQSGGNGDGDDPDNPQNKLLNGEIPEDFKRQMFYTLGDYRDICVGKTPDGIDTVSASDSGNNKSSKNPMQEISDKIKQILNGDNKQPSGVPPNSVKDPKDWWELHGKDIWRGMVCALTYKESDKKPTDGKPEKDEQVYKKFFGENNNRNPPLPVTPDNPGTTGTYESKYKYEDVSYGASDTTAIQAGNPDRHAGKGTKLKDFVNRPTYFRWLEEWGEEFCRKRIHKLKIIEKECKVEANSGPRGRGGKKTPQCSCYGEHCQDNLNKDPSIVPSLDCPGCGRECRKYKKWINTKRTEYEKQKEAYSEQKKKCVNGNNKGGGDNGFSTTIAKYNDAAEFLQKLGPCSKKYNSEDNGDDKLDFTNTDETFRPATNCKPCSKFKINCENGNCDKTKGQECKDNKITADDIQKLGTSTEDIGMVVSDDSPNGFNGDLKSSCENAGIFTGIIEKKWICGKVCGYNVCKPAKVNGQKEIGEKHIITIRALVTHWVHNFLEDYNKIKKKLNPCINDGKQPKCIKTCDKKCNCVVQWIEKKKEEWKKIKEHYQKQYGGNDSNNSFSVKTILEEFKERPEFQKAIKPCPTLEAFEKSKECTETANTKNDKKSDIIDCMLKKLEDKAKTCADQDSGENPENQCEQPPPLPDDEEEEYENEDENEKKVEQPGFCPKPKETKEKEDEKCEAAAPPPSEEQTNQTPEQTPVLKPEEEAPPPEPPVPKPPVKPAPAPAPASPPAPPPVDPPQADEPFDSTILQTTIPFGVALALGSIAFLFLKVKENIYVWGILVLEPSKRDTPSSDTPSSDTPMNKFTDEEWNELKHDFISQYVQSEPLDVPQYDVSTELPMNIGGNVLDDGINEKPFITSIHDRDLYTGEEISYNINMGTNSMDDTSYVSNNVYSGIDLINDTLSGNQHIDIYDEVLKRKENELFGTNYKKNTSNNNVAKLTSSDPIMNQLDLLHKWLDRHRDMCEKWNNKDELLDKLNEEWNKDNDGGDIPNDNKMLNMDVSIEIDMDDPKGKKEFSNMDTNVDTPTMDNILDDLETCNEPFYDIYEDDIYYDVNDENPSVDNIPMDHNKVDVPKKVHIEMKILNNTSNGSLEQEFPISDVWNI